MPHSNTTTEVKSKSSTLQCSFCKKAGHTEETCFKKDPKKLEDFKSKKVKGPKITFGAVTANSFIDEKVVPIFINDHEVDALVDTGACISFITESLANNLSLNIQPCNEQFRL